jgi:hypothetical protein
VREQADTIAARAYAPGVTIAQVCRVARTAAELLRTANALERTLARHQQKPVPFFGTVMEDAVDIAAVDAVWRSRTPASAGAGATQRTPPGAGPGGEDVPDDAMPAARDADEPAARRGAACGRSCSVRDGDTDAAAGGQHGDRGTGAACPVSGGRDAPGPGRGRDTSGRSPGWTRAPSGGTAVSAPNRERPVPMPYIACHRALAPVVRDRREGCGARRGARGAAAARRAASSRSPCLGTWQVFDRAGRHPYEPAPRVPAAAWRAGPGIAGNVDGSPGKLA